MYTDDGRRKRDRRAQNSKIGRTLARRQPRDPLAGRLSTPSLTEHQWRQCLNGLSNYRARADAGKVLALGPG